MSRFEVTIRLRISDRPNYEQLHTVMIALGFLPLDQKDGKFFRYSYSATSSAEALLNIIAQAISPVQKSFAIFVYDRENGKSVGSVN